MAEFLLIRPRRLELPCPQAAIGNRPACVNMIGEFSHLTRDARRDLEGLRISAEAIVNLNTN
jgi:hypothetical protein